MAAPDKNVRFKPMVVNREDLDPLSLVRAGRGIARDVDWFMG